MAIINCKQCGGKVSDKAKACPHCGTAVQKTYYNVSSDAKVLKENEKPLTQKKRSTSKIVMICGAILILLSFGFYYGHISHWSSCYTEYIIYSMKGDAEAQANLGHWYLDDEDYEMAVKWLRKAAEQEHADAQFNLGRCYQNGLGVPQDYNEAVKWYQKAAEQGDASAQTNLGLCYLGGDGVPQDINKAIEWFQKAAEQGHWVAQFNLGNQYFGVDIEKAVEWYHKAAEQGYADAQVKLAWCYLKGYGVPEDMNKAIEWFQKAADQGNEEAEEMLQSIDN